MRCLTLCVWLATVCCVSAWSQRPRNYDTHDYYALHIHPNTSPEQVASHLGLEHEGQLANIPDHHMFRCSKGHQDVVKDAIKELKARRRKRDAGSLDWSPLDAVLLNQKQVLRKRLVKRGVPKYPGQTRQLPPSLSPGSTIQKQVMTELGIKDPIFHEQWHLFNAEQPGNDLNVTGVWLDGVTGKNSTVCIVDDGLDMDSEDLRDNYYSAGSYDFNDKGPAPKPRLSDDRHGTRCAGEVSAVKNDACGVGVAYESRIAGVRILSAPISDADEAESVVYGYQENDIYSCSWGPPDDGRTMEAPGILIRRSMVNAIQNGRGGRGTIYVFAAGNGAPKGDNCNFDGYTNSIYSVTVGAIDRENKHPWYSESCSALLVVTYSSSNTDQIHTTDVGINKCTSGHGGTSAAGPLAAGVYALVLEVRPEATWRDIQWLQVMTARPFESDEPGSEWQETTLGRKFSHMFGYGRIDAYDIVEMAKTWKLVKPQAWYWSPWIHVKHEIPQGNQGVASTFEVTKQAMEDANLERLEHIQVTMNVEHSRRGDLSVELRSPSGIVSHLSVAREHDEHAGGYTDWTFMSVAHWGEPGVGNWTVVVKDATVNENKGSFVDWKLRLWGEAIDAKAQQLLPMPEASDDDDHDATTTAHVTTTDVTHPTKTKNPGANISHTPDRPVNVRPSDTGKPSSGQASISSPASGTTIVPIASPTTNPTTTSAPSSTAAPTTSATPTPSAAPDSFLPSPFPTFGVSKRTQIWIYASLALILIFCCSLGLYFYLARRRRLRANPRDDYEFEMLDDADDADGGARGVNGGLGGKKVGKKRRAGELYDAFAGESEEELFSGSEDEGGLYRDEIGGGSGSRGSEERVDEKGGR
ncbi:subtilisin-like protein [Aulographum hederae CBS 113979]|uniref:Subtilisin-like protein n=1 Tax=Aulographum hederae CBS 113979 TaxID=1176131 RepID=A0A6G1GL48_9PEZI|nr:subtilisin-like protein [Aulographum hederae CBS 113979]